MAKESIVTWTGVLVRRVHNGRALALPSTMAARNRKSRDHVA
jgi:hypothetical protein